MNTYKIFRIKKNGEDIKTTYSFPIVGSNNQKHSTTVERIPNVLLEIVNGSGHTQVAGALVSVEWIEQVPLVLSAADGILFYVGVQFFVQTTEVSFEN